MVHWKSSYRGRFSHDATVFALAFRSVFVETPLVGPRLQAQYAKELQKNWDFAKKMDTYGFSSVFPMPNE